MTPGDILLISIFPIAVFVIFMIKQAPAWLVPLRKMTMPGRVLVLLGFFAISVVGGVKPGPGPSISNLRILLAERAANRLSTGLKYGDKESIRTAAVETQAATNSLANVATALPGVATAITNSTTDVGHAKGEERHYFRLVFPRPVSAAQTLYGETVTVTVSNGIAHASVWFSVTPNVEPQMRFTFASAVATNRIATVPQIQSSYPDTHIADGLACYRYDFPVPSVLLDANGELYAPLSYERQIAFGAPETGEPFDLQGGLAIYEDGQFYTTVTGFRTNTFDGTVLYFDNGRLAQPPSIQETPNEDM